MPCNAIFSTCTRNSLLFNYPLIEMLGLHGETDMLFFFWRVALRGGGEAVRVVVLKAAY